jgi:hypothetical protein
VSFHYPVEIRQVPGDARIQRRRKGGSGDVRVQDHAGPLLEKGGVLVGKAVPSPQGDPGLGLIRQRGRWHHCRLSLLLLECFALPKLFNLPREVMLGGIGLLGRSDSVSDSTYSFFGRNVLLRGDVDAAPLLAVDIDLGDIRSRSGFIRGFHRQEKTPGIIQRRLFAEYCF